jgi:hypothetical protein
MNTRGSRACCIAITLLVARQSFCQQVKQHSIRQKTAIYTVNMSYPEFIHPTPAQAYAAATFKADAMRNLKAFKRDAPENAKAAGVEGSLPLTLESNVHITYTSPDLVAGYTDFEEFDGGAHGSTGYQERNVGMRNGKPVLLSRADIFRAGLDIKKLETTLIVPLINAKKENGSDPITEIPDGEFDLYVITNKGLQWLFPPYQVGSYAEGSFIVTVPWSKLKSYLKPAGPMSRFIHRM